MLILKHRPAALLAAACLLHGASLWATTYNFDTNKGTLNDQSVGTFFGDQLSASISNNVATFTFNGNLAFAPGDSIVVNGSRPLNVISYGDITLPSGLTVNVSASGTVAVAGGGTAGAGGTAQARQTPSAGRAKPLGNPSVASATTASAALAAATLTTAPMVFQAPPES